MEKIDKTQPPWSQQTAAAKAFYQALLEQQDIPEALAQLRSITPSWLNVGFIGTHIHVSYRTHGAPADATSFHHAIPPGLMQVAETAMLVHPDGSKTVLKDRDRVTPYTIPAPQEDYLSSLNDLGNYLSANGLGVDLDFEDGKYYADLYCDTLSHVEGVGVGATMDAAVRAAVTDRAAREKTRQEDSDCLYKEWRAGRITSGKLGFDMYLVGGAVRDGLLGREAKDRDFVVVGATESKFLAKFPNAQRVGKSFPVYLVPTLGEVAFARTERRIGHGHNDFAATSDPTITLQDDLQRRDLTVNAIAESWDGQHFAPLGGNMQDIREKKLRPVGAAFQDDALRVFRLARFAAQLPDFTVTEEAIEAMMRVTPESLSMLPPSRIVGEFRKAMSAPAPRRFIEVLEQVGVLNYLSPDIEALRNVPAGPPEHHPEGDALTHTLMVMDEVVRAGGDEAAVVAALLHDIGKVLTPVEKWPAHHGHEDAGVPLVEKFAASIRLPNVLRDAAILACREHTHVHRFLEMRKGKKADLVKKADQTVLRAEGLALVAEADARGRGLLCVDTSGPEGLRVAAPAVRQEKGAPIPETLSGEHIGLHVRCKKGNAAETALRRHALGKTIASGGSITPSPRWLPYYEHLARCGWAMKIPHESGSGGTFHLTFLGKTEYQEDAQ